MKFDYDLIEKIGATHYDNTGRYLKVSGNDGSFYEYIISDGWTKAGITPYGVIHYGVSAIPPRPETEYEYKKVTLSNVGDFVQEVHDNYGKYYFLNKCSGEYQLAEFQDAAYYWKEDNVYRRIEKPKPDWRDELAKWQHTRKIGIFTPLDIRAGDLINGSPEKFLEMCRVALRATGELE